MNEQTHKKILTIIQLLKEKTAAGRINWQCAPLDIGATSLQQALQNRLGKVMFTGMFGKYKFTIETRCKQQMRFMAGVTEKQVYQFILYSEDDMLISVGYQYSDTKLASAVRDLYNTVRSKVNRSDEKIDELLEIIKRMA